ncbi:MAG TPA: SDR family NAD(P)-dependent oxidoreductase [Hyphomicrobium sp.]|nr:SDR family NAD(P)-dependent oxidoreductase [Hyphomicrobium sp.]
MIRFVSSLVDPWLNRRNRDTPERRAARAAVEHLTPAVVITGGSRGIGYALARVFLAHGHTVLIVARGEADLTTARQLLEVSERARCSSLALDVTARDAADRIATKLADDGCYLDVLVNNSATGLSGPFDLQTGEMLDKLIAVNVTAVTRLMDHALRGMLARGRGGILNMASLGGYVPGPNQAAYYASKAYVLSLSEAVASEISGRGVRVCVVAPGPVGTRFHADMGADTALYRKLLPEVSPGHVARAAYRAFTIGQRVVVPGIAYRLAFLSLRLLPHTLSVPLTGRLLKNPDG